MYRDKRDGELYEDYESAYDAMLEGITMSDYVQAKDWDVETLLTVILYNCPDAIANEILECETQFFNDTFEEVDEEEE